MALSGTFGSTFATGYRVEVDWTATQNAGSNYSDVTARFYLVSLGSGYSIDSSSQKNGNIVIDGTVYGFTNTVGLSGNQRKLLHTATKRISHYSDGTRGFGLSAKIDIGFSLGGGTISQAYTGVGNFTLDSFAKASTISSNVSWTALNSVGISVTRASTSFTHIAELRVGGLLIKSSGSFSTSTNFIFDLTENTQIIQRINANNKDTATVEFTLKTYNGSTLVGTTVKTGIVTAPPTSTISLARDLIPIGSPMELTASKYVNTLDIRHVYDIELGSFTHSFTTTDTDVTWTPSTAQQSSMFAQIPTTNSRAGTLTVTTLYNGVQVRNPRVYDWTATASNLNPTFNASQFSYADTNSSTVAITGNNQMLISGKSSLSVTLSSLATPVNGATITSHVITVNGLSQTVTATGTYNLGTITATSNVTLTIRAIDSRGNSTTATKTVNVIPYYNPSVLGKGVRNGDRKSVV